MGKGKGGGGRGGEAGVRLVRKLVKSKLKILLC